MLNQICNLVSTIVFSGINGAILIPLLIFLLWIGVGQVKDFINVVNKVWEEGV